MLANHSPRPGGKRFWSTLPTVLSIIVYLQIKQKRSTALFISKYTPAKEVGHAETYGVEKERKKKVK